MLNRKLVFRACAARTLLLCALFISAAAGSYAQCTFNKLIPQYFPMGSIPGNNIPGYPHDFITG
ncbi:MAG: hypothetical protein J7578_23495, partial [Chitinophagaceae bacterium]|nr:hypothetical protein [Chitinophagaceae bacterium]